MKNILANILQLVFYISVVSSDLPASRRGVFPHIRFEPFIMPAPAPFYGRLARNGRLDGAELVWNGPFEGAESIAYRGDEAYTGVIGGYIIRIDKNGSWEKIVQTGTPCAGPWEMIICGRPLGLRFGPDGKLLVTDYTKGLLRIDVDRRTVETLIPRYSSIAFGKEDPLNVADDLDVSKGGIIYFSDIGQRTVYGGDFLVDGLGDPTGRLIKYNPFTEETEVLLRGLRFANGVQLSQEEDFVAVNEMAMGRTWKVYLTGNRTGQSELFVENLPGLPDNIRPNGKGGFYISVVTTRYSAAMHFGPVGDYNTYPRHAVIVEVDETGNILSSLQNQRSGVRDSSSLDRIHNATRPSNWSGIQLPWDSEPTVLEN